MFQRAGGSEGGTGENRQSLTFGPKATDLAIWTPKDLSALIRWALQKGGALIQRIQNKAFGYSLSLHSPAAP
jgi:hypothetical protein